ncbi:MAG: OprO/OprP family phosphate-selective porin [Panacagrimonas sp.]
MDINGVLLKGDQFRVSTQRLTQALLVAAFVGAPVAAIAAPSAEELDQRIKILERQLEIQKEEAETKAKDASTASFGDKGLSVKKGDFELKFKGLIQADVRAFTGDEAPRFNDTATLRRLRPTFEGTLGKLVGFRLTPEFAGTGAGDVAGSNSIVDAYIDIKFDPAFTLRAGKVKGPVALERLQSGGALNFVERGFVTELAPNRDLGIQFQGELLGSTVSYTLGYYNGTADGRDVVTNDGDNRKEVGARLFFEPFKNEPGFLQGFGFGVGSSFGTKEQPPVTDVNNATQVSGYSTTANGFLPRYRTPGQNTFFSYSSARSPSAASATTAVSGRTGVFASGDHLRISPQLYFYRNSFGLLGEYITSEQDLAIGTLAGGVNGTAPGTDLAFTEESLENTAWQVVSTYVLTGEDASFRGVVKPTNAFTVGGPGWGAFELALRYGELEIDEDAFPAFASANTAAEKVSSYSVGINWYLTSNLKAVLNYSQTEFDGGAGLTASTATDREDEKAVFGRFQVSF